MKAALYVIVDVSGSMNEMGKIHLQRNLCRYAAQLPLIDQEKCADFDICFYQWAQNISEIALQSDGDIPVLNAEGSSSLSVLSDFLSQNLNNTERSMALILSDGNFSNSDILSFQKQLSSLPDLIIRTVAVGADADLLKLKKISTNNSVYLSENIASAIESTIFGVDECMAAPESTVQIQLWNSWGASVIGPLHVKAGIPNQDSWMARRYKWGNVIVVSDGLGSKAHSDHGSKAACLAVFEAAKSYQNTPETNIVDILRLIHANWLVKIAPYSPSDCSATCLFAIQIEGVISLGRLGDGMIAVYGEAEKNCLILSDNKLDSFSNYTNSLQQEFKPGQWETATIESAECNAVVLCTDGISDDLLPEKQMIFTQELYSTYADQESEERKKDLKRWLNEWPVPGHSDDKTIACLFKERGSPAMR